jgi:hypothetical protein
MSAVPALAALLLLAGCVSIPTSGDVRTEAIDSDPPEVATITLPESPVAGQDQADILQGFIRAGRAPQGPYSVAREFLAPGTEWNGTSRVLVTTNQSVPVPIDDDTLGITVTVVGEVDATGHYTEVPGLTQVLTYDFTVVDGENRISRADPGTVLSEQGFSRAFDAYPLYFFDTSFEYLVPDLRWFPVTRTVADRIVRELLVGPAPWLQSSVLVSAFPQGVTGKADYEAPEVNVELSGEVRAESALTQRRMLQQLGASLDVLGNVNEVNVAAGELDLAPSPDSPIDVSYSVGDGAVGGVDGRLGVLSSEGLVPLSKIGIRADGLESTAASLARDRASVALLGPVGVTLVGETGDPVPIDARGGLVAPSLDPHGFTWSVPRNDPSGLLVVDANGDQRALPLPVDGEVIALEVSRDGARVLLALATSNGPRVTVLGIQRDADLLPVAFGTAYDLDVDGPVIDIAWVDGAHVAVLWADDGGSRADVLALGGPREPLGEIDGAVSIVGGNLVAGIRVLLGDGSVWRPSEAGGWRDTGLVASFLATQQ